MNQRISKVILFSIGSLLMVFCYQFSQTNHKVYAQGGGTQPGVCGKYTICTDPIINYCIGLPTSLPPVKTQLNPGEVGVYKVASSHCGARRCYLLFACQCGPPLSGSLCRGGISPHRNSSNACQQTIDLKTNEAEAGRQK